MLQILDELGDSSRERFLRVAVERSEFPSEHALPFVSGHDGDRRRCERKSTHPGDAGTKNTAKRRRRFSVDEGTLEDLACPRANPSVSGPTHLAVPEGVSHTRWCRRGT